MPIGQSGAALRLAGRNGSAATEAILALMVLVPLFAAMISLGDLWADQLALDHAAAAAVRRAAVQGGDSPELRSQIAADLLAAGLPAAAVSATVMPARPSWQEPITVSLELPRRLQLPLLGGWDLVLQSRFSGLNEVGPGPI